MAGWWHGTGLVASRGMVESLRSRTFRVVSAVLLLLSLAAVVVPQLIGHRATTYTLATVGPVPTDLQAALQAAAHADGFTVRFTAHADRSQVTEAVRKGTATAGLAGGVMLVSSRAGTLFPATVAQAVVALEARERLQAAGLTPEQIADLQSVRPPPQVVVQRSGDTSRGVVGFAAGIALYLAITFAGATIATTVALEKSSRIGEVLVSVLRPSQVLVGTVLAAGAVTLLQLLVLAVPVAVATRVGHALAVPAAVSGDIALAVAWFVLGFALYAFLFAAAAALVDRVTEASAATMPVSIMLVLGYLLAVSVVMPNPSGAGSVVLSMFPLTAPLAMPIRWAAGGVPVYQLLLAMALTVAAGVGVVMLASAVYRRALVITGHRVRWREVLHRA